MQVDDYQFMLDCAAKFHNTLYLYGWFYHPQDTLVDVVIHDDAFVAEVKKIGIPHQCAETALGKHKGFSIQILRNNTTIDHSIIVEFKTKNGKSISRSLLDLSHDRQCRYVTPVVEKKFLEYTSKKHRPKVLDIGGRDRSQVDRSLSFPDCDYTVFDILPGNNVDIIGDAHQLSDCFAKETFDFICSVSVFEHLLMPWKVVLEMNAVLKTGGVAFIHTHQTIGMHDMPWDFWRFSSDSWKALFNKKTGFEIIETAMDGEQFIVPFHISLAKNFAEKAAGYEESSVLARKTHNTDLQWHVATEEITKTLYPTH